ncbi:MAG: dockerin type I repeat-containing protein, partial [Clostridiaceae bacterium]|nr:dockerin type I repeat-containing protein [Clostridiaceae bacterium]
MKKFIAVLSAVSLAAALTVGASAATLGDVNGDGAINSADALGVLQYSVGIENKGFIKANADVNGDGTINSSDALKILKVSVGLETIDKSKKEVVEYYNNALKKTYAQAKRAKVTTDDSGIYSINGKVSEIKSNPASVEAEFVNGKDKDGFAVSLYGPETKLTEDMLSSASIVKQGGNLKITLIIKSEKVDVKSDAVYNAAGAFPFEYCSDKTEIKSFTSGYVTY